MKCLNFFQVGQIIALSVLTFAILHPDVLYEHAGSRGEVDVMSMPVDFARQPPVDGKLNEENVPALPTPLSLANPEPEMLAGRRNFQFSKADMMLFTKKRLESGDCWCANCRVSRITFIGSFSFIGDAHLALALVFGLAMITMLMIFGAIKVLMSDFDVFRDWLSKNSSRAAHCTCCHSFAFRSLTSLFPAWPLLVTILGSQLFTICLLAM